jgi:Group II intron, maturase-specific domain
VRRRQVVELPDPAAGLASVGNAAAAKAWALMGGRRDSHPLAPPEPGVNLTAHRWAAYYGRFCPSETVNVLFHIDRYLVRWGRRKYKHLRRAPRRAARTLAGIKRDRPGLLAHWRWEVVQRAAAARAG